MTPLESLQKSQEQMLADYAALEPLRALVAQKQAAIAARGNEDPWAFPEAQELITKERAAARRYLDTLHPGNRFRLLFDQPLLTQ